MSSQKLILFFAVFSFSTAQALPNLSRVANALVKYADNGTAMSERLAQTLQRQTDEFLKYIMPNDRNQIYGQFLGLNTYRQMLLAHSKPALTKVVETLPPKIITEPGSISFSVGQKLRPYESREIFNRGLNYGYRRAEVLNHTPIETFQNIANEVLVEAGLSLKVLNRGNHTLVQTTDGGHMILTSFNIQAGKVEAGVVERIMERFTSFGRRFGDDVLE